MRPRIFNCTYAALSGAVHERLAGVGEVHPYLVNMARGGVVDQAALTAALRDGEIAGAGLDCLAPEPPLASDDIVRLRNVIALPHVGAATHETREALALMAADNVVAVLTGRPPRAIVNPEVLGGPHKGSD
jgi:phosphoglycerate dehydrogenase-like enzyme